MLALAALLGAFAYLYARSERLAGAAPAAVPVIVLAGVLGAIAVGCEALPTYLQVPLIIAGQPLLIIAIVAAGLLGAWRTAQGASGTGPSGAALSPRA
jgi:protein-S-isoprenylcysteine O-methyltransferase Ste14